MLKVLIALFVVMVVLSIPLRAEADTPTPTPTPPASTPTPVVLVTPVPLATGAYQNLKVTPTPWSITPVALGFDTGAQAAPFADTVINAYRFIDIGNVMDWVMLVSFVLFVARALFALIEKIKGM